MKKAWEALQATDEEPAGDAEYEEEEKERETGRRARASSRRGFRIVSMIDRSEKLAYEL